MLGCEEHLPKAHRIRIPVSPHRDSVRRVSPRGEIFQEEPVFGRSSKPTMDEEERRFRWVVVGGYSTEEFDIPSRSGDVGTRDGRVESDGESKVLPGRPLDVEQWHDEVQGRGWSRTRGDCPMSTATFNVFTLRAFPALWPMMIFTDRRVSSVGDYPYHLNVRVYWIFCHHTSCTVRSSDGK